MKPVLVLIAILNGPSSQDWLEVCRETPGVEAHVVSRVQDLPEAQVVVVPDCPVSEEDARGIEALIERGGKVIATGYAGLDGGAFRLLKSLRVGRGYFYVPLLYPNYLEFDMEEYERRARWSAENGADGIGIFAYVFTLPRYGEDVPEVIARCFEEFPAWKTRESVPPLGIPPCPRVMFMHINDTRRIGPGDAAAWAARLNANVVSITTNRFRVHGLYASPYLIDSVDNTPVYLPRLIEACKGLGIQVWANIVEGGAFTPSEDELQVYQDGESYGRACPLAGREFHERTGELIAELLEKFPDIAAVTLDEPWVSCRGWKRWACFCPQCKAAFAEAYGKELVPENVIIDHGPGKRQSITAEFDQFRKDLLTRHVFECYRRAINRVRPTVALGFWNPKNYGVIGISPSMVSDAGVSIFGPEKPHAGAGGYLHHPEDHRPTWFKFARLEPVAVQGTPFEHLPLGELAGEGAPMLLYDGATVLAWMTDGDTRWPAVVSAREGRALYVSSDPGRVPGQGGREFMQALARWAACGGDDQP